LYLAPIPLITAGVAFALWRCIPTAEVRPFALSISLFALGYAGLAVSRWPFVVPPSITIWEAASAPETQLFILVGTAITLPLVLGYTFYVYRVFRGKVRIGQGYH